jgi:hypothetical protein
MSHVALQGPPGPNRIKSAKPSTIRYDRCVSPAGYDRQRVLLKGGSPADKGNAFAPA